MNKKRIIPCLDVKEGRTVKGVNFVGLKDAGDPVELARKYDTQGADELVFLDITATVEGRKATWDMVSRIADSISIPFTVGGGIRSLEDIAMALEHGADKVAINSAAVYDPGLVSRAAEEAGSSRLVIAIDGRINAGEWWVYVRGGQEKTELKLLDWAKEVESRGAGEILFTSMEHDGTRKGFALDILKELKNRVNIPLIASGGAGTKEDFLELFKSDSADAGLAASVFHYNQISVPELREYLQAHDIPLYTSKI